MYSAEKSLEILLNGNKRFIDENLEHPNQSKERRHCLKASQKPFAVVVGCADSRVPPEIIFDQGIGDLFVIRTAGNLVDDFALGSIEYAVKHLNVKLVMILGHVDCGVIKSAIGSSGDENNDSKISTLTNEINPLLEKTKKMSGDLVENTIKENVCNVKETVLSYKQLEEEGVKIVGAYYDWHSGKVEILD